MKNQLLKKFYACLPVGMAFISMMLFSIITANAQIILTDLNPDIIVEKGQYSLDLNNDGTTDYTIVHFVTRPTKESCVISNVSISATNANTVASLSYPLAMNLNDSISSGRKWSASGDLRYIVSANENCSADSAGYWNIAADHFLGLKLIVGTDTYYGWLRMQITGSYHSTSAIIKDFAYNTIPNQTILAGQTTSTGIRENIAAASITLYPNPTTNYLSITLPAESKKAAVSIVDIAGKIIYSATLSETQKIEVNTKDFADGVYFVQVQSEDFIATKKLVVKK